MAAVILGGTSLFGDTGTIVGSLVGLTNGGLILMAFEFSRQLIIRAGTITFGGVGPQVGEVGRFPVDYA